MTRGPHTLEGLVRILRGAGIRAELQWAGTEVEAAVSARTVLRATQDSRDVQSGDLFLAWQGIATDAHRFVPDAAAGGAVAAVVEHPIPGVGIPLLVVEDGRHAAAVLAQRLEGSPFADGFLFAVTGTNGKTTSTVLARHLVGMRTPCALIGTLGVLGTDGMPRPGGSGLTSPGPVELARLLRREEEEGARALGMEASSHALHQRRLDGLRFSAAAFTNLSRDHLDYHGSMEEYRRAKLRLVDLLRPGGTLVLHAADPAWAGVRNPRGETLLFGIEGAAHPAGEPELRAEALRAGAEGTRFVLVQGDGRLEVMLPLPGPFNVENALAAAGIALASGLSLEEVAAGLEDAPQVPGRLELVATEPCRILIDFAHTPEALERVLATLRPLVRGRLVVVFGAGGDRDRGKRPRMGRVVEEGADWAIVTSDNPRTEDPGQILDDIVQGMPGGRFERIEDRRAAVDRAIEGAGPDDLIVLAGKGHERTQTIGGKALPFDEREVVGELLRSGRRGG